MNRVANVLHSSPSFTLSCKTLMNFHYYYLNSVDFQIFFSFQHTSISDNKVNYLYEFVEVAGLLILLPYIYICITCLLHQPEKNLTFHSTAY